VTPAPRAMAARARRRAALWAAWLAIDVALVLANVTAFARSGRLDSAAAALVCLLAAVAAADSAVWWLVHARVADTIADIETAVRK
jgi:hypothetical protein